MKPKLRFSNFINDYEIKDVSDITSNISSGKISKQFEDGEYNVYGSMGIIGKSNFYDYAGEKVLVARVGANAGSVNKINEKWGLNLEVEYYDGLPTTLTEEEGLYEDVYDGDTENVSNESTESGFDNES